MRFYLECAECGSELDIRKTDAIHDDTEGFIMQIEIMPCTNCVSSYYHEGYQDCKDGKVENTGEE